MSGQEWSVYTIHDAEKLAMERSQRFNSSDPVPGAKKGTKNSDAKEYFGVGCPCGWRFRKQDQERATDRAMRLHAKVCKVAQEIEKSNTKPEHHRIVTVRGGILSTTRTE